MPIPNGEITKKAELGSRGQRLIGISTISERGFLHAERAKRRGEGCQTRIQLTRRENWICLRVS